MQKLQALLEPVDLFFVLFLGQRLRQIHTGEHAVLIPLFLHRRFLRHFRLRSRFLSQGRLEAVRYKGHDLGGGVILVRRLDDGPRRTLRIGLLKHLLVDLQITVILLVPPPVILCHTPGRLLGVLQLLEAFLLLFLGNIEEQLDNHHSAVIQLALKG